MANGSLITNNGKKILLYRAYTENGNLSSTQYLSATQFQVGVNNATPVVSDNSITSPVPITDGTVCDDGSNTFTGSNGGDNSTDNTSTYKEGAGVTDATAQNLITTGSNTTKTWTIADLTSAGSNADATKYIGIWLYIKDSTTLAKFASAGTAVEFRLGTDSTTNYYSQTWTAADLSVGWNWLSDGELLSTWTANGTPGTLNDFQINITTNNAADAFVAGDVVYDLLRQWQATDLYKDIDANYPSVNYTTLEATTRCTVAVGDANGFLINGLGIFNEDTSRLMTSEDTVEGDSKSSTDEFIFTVVDRVI